MRDSNQESLFERGFIGLCRMKRILIISDWKNRFQVEDSNNLTNVIAVRKQRICSAHRAFSSFTCRMTSTKVNGIQEVQKERMWPNYLVSYETSFSGFSIALNSHVALIHKGEGLLLNNCCWEPLSPFKVWMTITLEECSG